MKPIDLVLLAGRYDARGRQEIATSAPTLDSSILYEAIGISYAHRVTAPLADAIRGSTKDMAVRWAAGESARMLRWGHAINVTEFRHLMAEFERAGVVIHVLKGLLVDALVYSNAVPRSYNDLDILVTQENSSAAHQVLTECGYRQGELAPDGLHVTPFSTERSEGYIEELQHAPEYIRVDSTTGLSFRVDLHHRLATVFDHIAIDISALEFEKYQTRYGELSGLARNDMLCHLAYHAWWDTQSIANIADCRDLRLYQLADIRLLLAAGLGTTQEMLDRARALGCYQTANWALSVISHLWGDEGFDTSPVEHDAAREFDLNVSDRWLQRDTSTPLFTWDTPAWERIRNSDRGELALKKFFFDYVDAHTKLGDVMQWSMRSN